MNKDKAGELLGKFWQQMPEFTDLDESIYLIDLFIEYLYDEGFEIARIRHDWSGLKPGEKMGKGILKTGTFKRMKKSSTVDKSGK